MKHNKRYKARSIHNTFKKYSKILFQFSEREAKLRQTIRGVLQKGPETDDSAKDDEAQAKTDKSIDDDNNMKDTGSSKSSKNNKGKGKSKGHKPAWALTEDGAKVFIMSFSYYIIQCHCNIKKSDNIFKFK